MCLSVEQKNLANGRRVCYHSTVDLNAFALSIYKLPYLKHGTEKKNPRRRLLALLRGFSVSSTPMRVRHSSEDKRHDVIDRFANVVPDYTRADRLCKLPHFRHGFHLPSVISPKGGTCIIPYHFLERNLKTACQRLSLVLSSDHRFECFCMVYKEVLVIHNVKITPVRSSTFCRGLSMSLRH